MLEQIAEAFKRKDYQTAARILSTMVKQTPQDAWVHFYVGRLYEETDKLEAAEKVYRQVLRSTTHLKIVVQARQGLQRLEDIAKKRRKQAIAEATSAPIDMELGVLILEPLSPELKLVAAQKFARIMHSDPYTARLQLPSRGWRLHRLGPVGELRFYTDQLRQAEIPSFSASIADIQKINVYDVNYFQSWALQTVVACHDELGQMGSLTFNWSEVSQRVEGLLPIFEEVVDFDARHKLQRKTKTLDYVQFCDLHLPARRTILRLCDRNYQFQQGIAFAQKQEDIQPLSQITTRNNWNNLITFLNQQLPQRPAWSDFTTFAETAIDQTELLKRIKSHIDLSRRKETLWDPAFQLYSGLIFLEKTFQD